MRTSTTSGAIRTGLCRKAGGPSLCPANSPCVSKRRLGYSDKVAWGQNVSRSTSSGSGAILFVMRGGDLWPREGCDFVGLCEFVLSCSLDYTVCACAPGLNDRASLAEAHCSVRDGHSVPVASHDAES